MRAHILQHVPFEGPGSMAAWLGARATRLSTTCFWESVSLPSADDIDLLIVMGGPMSVHDEALHPWLASEKQFIAEVVGKGAAVLGVCLGAQLIATALGAKVYRNECREIGWFPVRAVSGPASPFKWPRTSEVMHWHGDTFDLPPRATLLASSPACFHQAFCVGSRVLGLQFHLETTPDSLAAMVDACGHELHEPGPWVQSRETLLAVSQERLAANNAFLDSLLETLVSNPDQTV